jgi:hypothetical protein
LNLRMERRLRRSRGRPEDLKDLELDAEDDQAVWMIIQCRCQRHLL